MNQYDTIVIGGGLGGLTTALLLAKQGQKVAVYEKAAQLGGRAQTRQRDGFALNLGPHALYRKGAALPILKSLGINPQGRPPVYGRDPKLVTSDGLALFPVTPATFLKSDVLRGRRLKYARVLRRILMHLPSAELDATPWQTWLQHEIADPLVRRMIAATGRLTTYANDPDRMSAGATLKQIKLGIMGNVLYLDGGWQQLVDALVEKAAAAGILIHTHSRVDQIERRTNGFELIMNGEKPVTGRNVVLAVGPKAAAALLPDSQALAQATTDLTPVKAACLTLGLRKLPRPERKIALGLDGSFYGVVHSASAELAPAGQHLLHTAVYIGPDDIRTPEEHRLYLEETVDLLQPGWRESASLCDFLPRLTVSHSLVEARRRRPSPLINDTPGAFLVGGWVDSEGMLADGVVASARDVARHICG